MARLGHRIEKVIDPPVALADLVFDGLEAFGTPLTSRFLVSDQRPDDFTKSIGVRTAVQKSATVAAG